VTKYWVYYVKWYSGSWLILDTIWDRLKSCPWNTFGQVQLTHKIFFFKFYYLTELLGFFYLSSISIYNEAKAMNFTIFQPPIYLHFILICRRWMFLCFCMKTKLYWNKLGIFLFSPPREIFPVIYVHFLHKRPFLLGFFDLSSISIYNEVKTMNFTIFQPPIYLV
jgi:hypothetical protein